jgi:hypothetical protein
MSKTGTYYLGRMIKLGMLDDEKIFKALANPTTIVRRGNAWTIINASKYGHGSSQFAYGRLCKFAPETEVAVIDLMKKEEVFQPERNVILASSPFVYIPEHSGIAFLQVWNHIEPHTFIRRFCSIVNDTHQEFFVQCQIDPVADIRTFALKLSKLDGIYRLSATVHPPNPLFGPLWRPLKEYLAKRRTETLRIQEDSGRGEPLDTRLAEHVAAAATDQTNPTIPSSPPLPIGDAAILMAVDGYGSGLVKGRVGSDFIVIRTSQTISNFSFDKDPTPDSLYEAALKLFERIKHNRHMEHNV